MERFVDPNTMKTNNTNIGPGTYKTKSEIVPANERRVHTAAFLTNRKDLLFSGNAIPGVGEYGQQRRDQTFAMKNWATNIGAFGTTEKRFSQASTLTSSLGNPGPGNYAIQKRGI